MSRAFRGIAVAIAVCLMTPALPAAASNPTPEEVDVKAAFLYNFLKFVDWGVGLQPADGDPLVLGILGADSLYESLSRMIEGKNVRGRPLAARRIDRRGVSAIRCDLLYIGCMDMAEARRALGSVAGDPVLTVGDCPGFARMGGIIGFTRKDDRVGFEINIGVARDSGLELSSRLLDLAVVIDD
jgi:hypothetical protein